MAKPVNGKYRIQVSLSEDEYQLLRRVAFDVEQTVNDLMRTVTVRHCELYLTGKE